MWSSEPRITRRVALFGALCGFAGCGFVPAYGTGGVLETLRDEVEVLTPQTVAGFRLGDRLRDRLGSAGSQSMYRLEVDLSINETGVAVTQEGEVTRFTLEGVAVYRLFRRGDGSPVAAGDTDSFTGYSTTDSTVATENARTNAEERLTRILADQILTRLQAGLA
jgi:LPS-assembly lipoprotein